ncbi:MAG: hypothetical protein SNG04_04490 [Rikenellaceae bacterium]
MTLIDYIKGSFSLNVTDEIATSVLTQNNLTTDAELSAETPTDLLIADTIMVFVRSGGSEGATTSSGQWSIKSGGVTYSGETIAQLRVIANDLYRKAGREDKLPTFKCNISL